MWIEIIKTPDGEAPEWVREKWVGLILPVINTEPYEEESFFELGKKPATSKKQQTGFFVCGFIALYLLAQKSIEAVNWFLSNTRPINSLLKGFIFSESEVKVILDKEEDPLSTALREEIENQKKALESIL